MQCQGVCWRGAYTASSEQKYWQDASTHCCRGRAPAKNRHLDVEAVEKEEESERGGHGVFRRGIALVGTKLRVILWEGVNVCCCCWELFAK